MSPELNRDEALVSTAEAEQAARLAAALDGRVAPDADSDALAAAFLLQAVGSARAGDEVAAARLRRLERELRAPDRRRWLTGVAAAAAVLVAAVGGWSTFHHRPPSATQLETRERQARQAVAALLARRPAVDHDSAGVAAWRQGELLAALQAERFESLRSTLLADQLETPAADTAQPTPTQPGGRTS